MSVVYLKTPSRTIFAYSPSGVFYVAVRHLQTIHSVGSYSVTKETDYLFPAEARSLCADNTREALRNALSERDLFVGIGATKEEAQNQRIPLRSCVSFEFSTVDGDADDHFAAFDKLCPVGRFTSL